MVPLLKTSQWLPVASGSLYHVVEGLLWSGLCLLLHLLSSHTLSLGCKLQPWWAFFFSFLWLANLLLGFCSCCYRPLRYLYAGLLLKCTPSEKPPLTISPGRQSQNREINHRLAFREIFYKVANPLFLLPTPVTFHRITLFSFLHRNQEYLIFFNLCIALYPLPPQSRL